MKILHVAPLWFPVSRDAPGGIETLLPALIATLEERGCRNTLIASGDSQTVAELIPATDRNFFAQMEDDITLQYACYEQHELLLTIERAGEFDVVHSHIGWGGYVLSHVPGIEARMLHTLHNAVTADVAWFVARHPDIRLSTVSEFLARRLRQAGATQCHVIPNAIDVCSFTFRDRSSDLLLFLGRMEEEKGPDLAVQVARRLNRPLVLAGPMADDEFFEKSVAPFLDERIQYVGMVGHERKNELFGQAGCVLMPSRWDEPFGLVAVEAMACGTPVVALAKGGLQEIVEPGVTGYLASDETDLADLVPRAVALDRATIRRRAEARFDMAPVAQQYVELYEHIAGGGGRLHP